MEQVSEVIASCVETSLILAHHPLVALHRCNIATPPGTHYGLILMDLTHIDKLIDMWGGHLQGFACLHPFSPAVLTQDLSGLPSRQSDGIIWGSNHKIQAPTT